MTDEPVDPDHVAASIADAFAAIDRLELPTVALPDVVDPASVAAAPTVLPTVDIPHLNSRLEQATGRAMASIERTIRRVLDPPRRVVIRWPERRRLTDEQRARRNRANRAARAARRRNR